MLLAIITLLYMMLMEKRKLIPSAFMLQTLFLKHITFSSSSTRATASVMSLNAENVRTHDSVSHSEIFI